MTSSTICKSQPTWFSRNMKGSWYLRVHREEFPTTASSTNVVVFFIAEHIVHVHSNLLSPFTLGNMDVILNARDDLMHGSHYLACYSKFAVSHAICHRWYLQLEPVEQVDDIAVSLHHSFPSTSLQPLYSFLPISQLQGRLQQRRGNRGEVSTLGQPV